MPSWAILGIRLPLAHTVVLLVMLRTVPMRLRPWMVIAAVACLPVTGVAQQPVPDRAEVVPSRISEEPEDRPEYDTSRLVDDVESLTVDDLPGLRARAEMGEPRAQVLLGLAHEFGSAGLPEQPQEALSWFLKAAEQGVPWAQAWAADFYLNGSRGIDRDLSKALRLYVSAANGGDARAAFFVGQMHFHGDGTALNHREAASWFRKANPEDSDLVARMVELAEASCDTTFCVALRQVMGALTAGVADRLVDGWDDTTREWDAAVVLPGSQRCGLTTSDRTRIGDLQNYFCDSATVDDEARGAAMAKQLADDVEKALPAGYTRTERADARSGPATFFARAGYPHLRVSYNVTPGLAQDRVTLLVGP
jgi:hypothetical protein